MRAQARVLLTLSSSSALSLAALMAEIHHTGNAFCRFLAWNLFLAGIPVLAALVVIAAARRNATPVAVLFAAVWVLFFPNAPYMLTDYIHLGERGYSSAPIWYDAMMLSAFVWTALLLGFFSLYLVQRLWTPLLGTAGSWAAVFVVFALSSFGVYLGRFVQYQQLGRAGPARADRPRRRAPVRQSAHPSRTHRRDVRDHAVSDGRVLDHLQLQRTSVGAGRRAAAVIGGSRITRAISSSIVDDLPVCELCRREIMPPESAVEAVKDVDVAGFGEAHEHAGAERSLFHEHCLRRAHGWRRVSGLRPHRG